MKLLIMCIFSIILFNSNILYSQNRIFVHPILGNDNGNNGRNIQHLIDSIVNKINNNNELTIKLNSIVCKTLGNSLEHSINIKFDYEIARESIQYYMHQDIDKIEKISIPDKISEVHFKSDLTYLNPIALTKLKGKQTLYNAL